MSHSYTQLIYHIVYSTKNRQPWLDPSIRPYLFKHLGLLVNGEGGVPLLINGVEDHVHMLVHLRQDRKLCDSVRAFKAKSSGWIHRTFPALKEFGWQNGYGAFSVSTSQTPRVKRYIANQEEHHKKLSFQDEYRACLRKHEITFSEEDVWD